MSAAVNSSLAYQSTATLGESESMLATGDVGISVTSRIDYNLRFTKQAVLVVGNNTEQYSQLASQFLVNLSTVKPTANHLDSQNNQINVAFISASSKLNDIQIRCRLIEQLFVKALFDPEESLAISIFRFAKQHSEAISIVVDHAHALSLQINYELCQLVALAKKHQLSINVVLFGLTEAAQQLTINKSLFKNKLVVIEAETGQVISLDDKRISLNKETSPLSVWQKMSLFGAMLLLAAVLVWVYSLIAEEVSEQTFTGEPERLVNSLTNTVPSVSENALTVPVNNPENLALIAEQKKNNSDLLATASEEGNTSLYIETRQATSEEINQVLLASSGVNSVNSVAADAGDVLEALVRADTTVNTNNEEKTSSRAVKPTIQKSITSNLYYQTQAKQYKNGYVVQITGFSDDKLLKVFLSDYAKEGFYSYERQLNNQKFTVITTQVFTDKVAAKAAIELLPVELLDRKPWLKSISSVIKEINTFTR